MPTHHQPTPPIPSTLLRPLWLLLLLLPPWPAVAQVSGGADLFIGSGVVVERPMVVAEAEWWVA